MARPPKARDTQLSQDEIVLEALRQFDEGPGEPSVRTITAALQVAPSAIYHHFSSRSEIVRAAVDLVWRESVEELLRITPQPLEDDPVEVLLAVGLATRRTWLAHFKLSPYMAANPAVDDFTRTSLGLMSNLMERLGLRGERAAEAFHTYASCMIGSALFAATRRIANQQLAEGEAQGRPFRTNRDAAIARFASDETHDAMDAIMEVSVTDPERDEELYVQGLRRLVKSLVSEA